MKSRKKRSTWIEGRHTSNDKYPYKKKTRARWWWLMPVILATQEAEIRRIVVQSQPGQIVLEILSQKNPSENRVGKVVQGVGPEFKPQYCKKKKKNPKPKNPQR
jgi:hypothetical protein